MGRLQAPVIPRLTTSTFRNLPPARLDVSRFSATSLRDATWQQCRSSSGPGSLSGGLRTEFHRLGSTGGIEGPPEAEISPGVFRSQTPRPGFLQSGVQELIIREARPEEYWEVADMHCAAFYPNSSFPMDFMLRSDRISSLLENLGMMNGMKKKCLVALDLGLQPPGSPPGLHFDGEKHAAGGPFLRPLIASFAVGLPFVSWTYSGLNPGPRGIVGSVTVGTSADFLKRRKPGNKRR